jgi:hypothetical protein
MGLDGTIKRSNAILSGDLNFIVSTKEIWGQNAQLDPLGPFLLELFKGHGLVDIEPVDVKPTFKNIRARVEGIGKRFDRFYIAEDLLSIVNRFRTWIVSTNIFDHFRVVLQFEVANDKIKYPFKFNSIWLANQEFGELVRNHRDSLRRETNKSPMCLLVSKLKCLKSAVINWEKIWKKTLKKYLCQIEQTLESMFSQNVSGIFSTQERLVIQELEQKKSNILKKEAKTYRQKSRVVWLPRRDANIRFFHQYADYRRVTNTVWEMINENSENIMG